MPKKICWGHLVFRYLVLFTWLLVINMQPVWAGMKDDRYDGNIFVVYAGNGSLVPVKETLAQSLASHRPAVLAFYVDDSSDCKQYAIVISRVQEYYGSVVDVIPVNVDTILPNGTYSDQEPGYYYSGSIPQVVVLNQLGQVVLNQTGQVPFEKIDDSLRQVFNLLPRTESPELKRRAFNEFSSELSN